MRKLLISLLLASAAASPALAGPRDHNDRDAARAERQQAHEDARAARDDARASRESNRPQFNGGGPQQFARPNGGGGNGPDRPQFAGRPDRPQFDGRPDRPDRPDFAGRPDPRGFANDRAERDAARQQR